MGSPCDLINVSLGREVFFYLLFVDVSSILDSPLRIFSSLLFLVVVVCQVCKPTMSGEAEGRARGRGASPLLGFFSPLIHPCHCPMRKKNPAAKILSVCVACR